MSIVPAPGVVLEGRYVLRSPLGQGGMGTVWRAEHMKLGTPVAIKLVSPAIAASPEILARFTREARLVAALQSPHVVRVLDFGVDQQVPYIVMELLEGKTLGARLARGALAHADTARIVQQVVRGLGRAHEAGIVHCDLKPENVFLAQVDGEEVVKILDFGVAKAPVSGDLAPLTRTGAVLGTLQYMSPEQLETRKKVDARSDLYALATIVFECVTGRPPFAGESIGELVTKICVAPLPIPSAVAEVPPRFDAWFARAAHREIERRFATAQELFEALVTALDVGVAATERHVTAPSAALETTAHGLIRGGTERAGYTIFPEPRARVLHLEMWGLWDMSTTRAFCDDVLPVYEVFGGKPFGILNRAQRWPPQKSECQELHREGMAITRQRGGNRVAVLVDGALTQMQIRRMWAESGADPDVGFFQSESEAQRWLAKPEAPDGKDRG